MSRVKTTNIVESNIDKSYEQIAHKLREQERVLPTQVLMTDREQARIKKQKLDALREQDSEEEQKPKNKREQKELDKREKAILRAQNAALDKYKHDIKVSITEDKMKK